MQYVEGFGYDDVCMIVGLEKRPELNGRAVRVCLPTSRIGADRVPCELLLGADKMALRSTNLFKIENEDVLKSEKVIDAMPRDDLVDAGLLLYTKRDSVVMAPGLIMSNVSGSPPMRRPKSKRSAPGFPTHSAFEVE